MKLVFIDESGYSPNWIADIAAQPFYVLSAICIDATAYPKACSNMRRDIALLNLPGLQHPVGKGAEIKARAVARGEGWWQQHNDERNKLRDLMLSFPARYDGVGLLVIIDKHRHRNQYACPEDPVTMSIRFLFERLEWHLRHVDSQAYCIYDHDKRRTDALHDQSAALFREGSEIIYWSDFYGEMTKTTHTLDRIVELALGKSDNSVGLQVADFFATMAYTYFRDGRPAACGWWDTLCASLYRDDEDLLGRGLKIFP